MAGGVPDGQKDRHVPAAGLIEGVGTPLPPVHRILQGKERRLDGTGWPWRVRLYGPAPGETGYQRIRHNTFSDGDFTPRSYADNVAGDVRAMFANSACVRPFANRARAVTDALPTPPTYPIGC